MKKWIWLLPLAALFAFSACTISGNVYLAFDWVSAPWDWYGTDRNIDTPNPADTLYAKHYYLTKEGDYYFAYTHDDIWWYDIYYTLTAHRGIDAPGQDALFMMYLNAGTYPTFWQTQGLGGASASSPSPSARTAAQSGGSFDKSGYEYRQLGEYTQTQGGYTLTARTGVWGPKQ
jgi:hypothetical protein